jgi:hypothetical protein
LIHKNFIFLSVIIYLFFGILQKFYDRRFGDFFLSSFRAADGFRGSNSLTTEPSFYSNQMIFLFILILFITSYDKTNKETLINKIFLSLIVFQITFLSQAITGIIWIIFLLSLIAISYRKYFLLFSIFLILPIISYLSSLSSRASRLNSFFYILNNNPEQLFTKDESINQRIADIIISTYGFFSKLPLSFGDGTNSWNNFIYDNYINFKFIIFPSLNSNKIMSGYGTVLFEIGIIGLLIIIIPYFFFILRTKNPLNISIGIFFSLFMFSAVQLSNPLFGFIYGYIIFLSCKNEFLEFNNSKSLTISLKQ